MASLHPARMESQVVSGAEVRVGGFVEYSDLPSLNLEADSLEQLADMLPGAVLDLLEVGGSPGDDGVDMVIELIAHASTRVRTAAA
jgi:hypothetical protein